jgi:two-component system NarL family sensor kinase
LSPAGESPLARFERESLTETERGVAWLRLAAVPLIAAGQQLPQVEPLGKEFLLALAFFWVYSLAALGWVYRLAVTRRFSVVVTALDLVAITASVESGGGVYSPTHYAFFLIPISVVFRFQPRLTLVATATTIAVYLTGALWLHPAHRSNGTYLQGLFQAAVLAWISAAAIVLSSVLQRRTIRVAELAVARERLLADSLSAGERERQTIAEGLHDSVIQNLLSVRHDIQEAAEVAPSAALVQAEEAVADTLASLRETVFELHPFVLEEAGLEAALRAVGARAARRAGATLVLALRYPKRHPHEGVLFVAASELLANAVTHAHAATIQVRLAQEDGVLVLQVADDGRGFDPGLLKERLAEGHIGLASQRVRIEAIGGRLEIGPQAGGGTRVEIRVPT